MSNTQEIRAFRMHAKLLVDVIKRQAGTITKAITEGVMNSLEAGATKVEINVTPVSVSIVDDGKGFRDRAEIEAYFETFGTPHDASEGKTWGRFRMGRGQMFAFGRNVWRTGQYEMTVDLQHAGEKGNYDLGYALRDNLPVFAGCSISIDLYEPIPVYEEARIADSLRYAVKYVSGEVFLNGNRINMAPSKLKWDQESEDCYVKNGGRSGARIFNLGVYVETNYSLGISADIVSRRQLDVNFARNQVLSTCPVWKRIRSLVAKESAKRVRAKLTLSDDERQFAITQVLSGEQTPAEILGVRLFSDTGGRKYSIRDIKKALRQYAYWSFGEQGDARADRLQQSKICLVFDRQILEWFNYGGAPAVFFGQRVRGQRLDNDELYGSDSQYRPIEGLVGLSECKFLPIQGGDLTKKERVFLDIARGGVQAICWKLKERKFRVNVALASGDADGWTDAKDCIWIGREWLKRNPPTTVGGLANLAALLIHELAHGESDMAAHGHPPEFFDLYHQITSDHFGTMVGAMFDRLVRLVEKEANGVSAAKALKARHERLELGAKRLPDIFGEGESISQAA